MSFLLFNILFLGVHVFALSHGSIRGLSSGLSLATLGWGALLTRILERLISCWHSSLWRIRRAVPSSSRSVGLGPLKLHVSDVHLGVSAIRGIQNSESWRASLRLYLESAAITISHSWNSDVLLKASLIEFYSLISSANALLLWTHRKSILFVTVGARANVGAIAVLRASCIRTASLSWLSTTWCHNFTIGAHKAEIIASLDALTAFQGSGMGNNFVGGKNKSQLYYEKNKSHVFASKYEFL
jgi:hypothetical protein